MTIKSAPISDPQTAAWNKLGITDPNAIAYLKRNPDVYAGSKAKYLGPQTAINHYNKYGKQEGRAWGATAVTPPAMSAAPSAAPPVIYGDSPDTWGAYVTQARDATAGMNRMPFVFSDYGNVPTDPALANALFYPPEQQGFRGVLSNALLLSAPNGGKSGTTAKKVRS